MIILGTLLISFHKNDNLIVIYYFAFNVKSMTLANLFNINLDNDRFLFCNIACVTQQVFNFSVSITIYGIFNLEFVYNYFVSRINVI